MDLSKYIGRPYEECNCLDLVKEFYWDQFNLKIKNYFEGQVPDRRDVESIIVSQKGDFALVTGKPEFGDIVVIKLYGIECHIGVCLGDGSFIHSIRGTGSVMERLVKYGRLIAGFYRHRGDSNDAA